MKREYHVQLPLADLVNYYTVAVAITPEAAGDCVRALLSADKGSWREIRVQVVTLPADQ